MERQRFGPFTLGERLGTGGMAEVYEAELDGPGGFLRKVALKLVHAAHADDDLYVRALLDEARIAVRISHPHVVHVYQCGVEDGRPYIALELVDGKPLHRILRDTALDVETALAVVLPLLDALHFVHGVRDDDKKLLGIVHRDVSPQNVLLSVHGDVKLTDFGVALAPDRLQTTATGAVKGKVRYMAPEQLEGLKLDGRADQFAAALVLFECLAGGPAYEGKKSDLELWDHVRAANIPDLGTRLAALDVPSALVEVLRKALSVAPSARYGSCAAFASALATFQREKDAPRQRERVAALVNRTQKPAPGSEPTVRARTPLATVTGEGLESAALVRAGFPRVAVPLIDALPKHECDAVSGLLPEHVRKALLAASRTAWLPLECSVRVTEAVERGLTRVRADAFWEKFMGGLFDVPFLSPVLHASVRLMGRDPRRMFNFVPRTFTYVYRGCGAMAVRPGPSSTSLRLEYTGLPPLIAGSSEWQRAGASSFAAIFRRADPSGNVVVEKVDTEARRMTFLVTWRGA